MREVSTLSFICVLAVSMLLMYLCARGSMLVIYLFFRISMLVMYLCVRGIDFGRVFVC